MKVIVKCDKQSKEENNIDEIKLLPVSFLIL